MAKLRGSMESKLAAINEALLLSVTSAQDHAELINMILGVSESINKLLGKKNPIKSVDVSRKKDI